MSSKHQPPQFTEQDIQTFVSTHYGINSRSIKNLGSYVDQNFLITDSSDRQYTCKVHDGSEQEAVLDKQNRVIDHLSAHIADVDFPRVIQALDGKPICSIAAANGSSYFVRLLRYLPGCLLKEVPQYSDALLQDIGRVLGEMDTVLQAFTHPAANRPDLPWDLKNALNIRHFCDFIEDHQRRRIAEYFFLQFEMVVAPQLHALRKSVVHNDAHRYSLLTDNNQQKITGVIDFGDTVYTHTITNLAICCSDMMVQSHDVLASAAAIIGSYHNEFPLTEQEVSLLYHLICTRLSIYGCMAAKSRAHDPDNRHARMKEDEVWALLEKMLSINPMLAEDTFRSACNMPSRKAIQTEHRAHMLDSRAKHFAGSLYTHYEEPLALSGGALQYLYDESGNTYLDCVNNVCQWGHCHPTIVRAGQRQMAKLNTNSRYLYEQMTDYAERLLATFPAPLDVVFFVNSGSEANDLALRLATTYTGNEDIIVNDKAYHGNSSVCTEISPNRIDREGGPGLPQHVHKTLIPDRFRGPYKSDDPNACGKYAADTRSIIADLAAKGKRPAAFIAESVIGTGGQIVLPEGYLAQVYQSVREAGGICIADEVQVGFGRTGAHAWCFESQAVVPDIVTMGKPIGNGHPMAAVVTTREIADAFDNGVTYFNTFGGNPVSCAIGAAVLDVLEGEKLEANALAMGERLVLGLEALKSQYTFIGDIRGQGLYLGVELVTDRESLAPATELAQTVVENMKANGILLNTNGYDNNIIKIKPPLIICEADIDRVVSMFDEVFGSVV
ncbi:MAG: aminotransferase class III-fold pyridoxal phosphate-dependent enzyme [Pseudomonadales bacterium]